MSDKEFYDKLKVLEPKMEVFNTSKGGTLSVDDVNLVKALYPKLQELAGGHMSKTFTSSCSSCIRETFKILTSVFYRLKQEFA